MTEKAKKAKPEQATPEKAKKPLHRRFVHWWFADLPAERIAMVRILVGLFAWWYLFSRFRSFSAASHLPVSNWKPIDLVAAVLDRPLDPATFEWMMYATQFLAFAFMVGFLHRYLAPVFAVLLLFVLTYRSSWGMVFHTENLLALHVIALALAPSADAWSVDRLWRKRQGAPPPEPSGKYAWGLRTAAVLTVTTYVLAGIAKLRLSGMEWLDGEQLRNQIGYDNIRKALIGDETAELAVPLLEHPNLFIPLSLMTLVVELGAPIALLGGKFAILWSLAAWGFHVGVILLMAIWFPYPFYGIAYAPLLAVDRPISWIIKYVRTGGRARPPPPEKPADEA